VSTGELQIAKVGSNEVEYEFATIIVPLTYLYSEKINNLGYICVSVCVCVCVFSNNFVH